MNARRRFGMAAAVSAGLILTACSLFQTAAPKPCPQVSLLEDAGRLTEYRPGQGRDLTDVLFEARIDDVISACKYVDDRVRVEAKIDIIVQHGPAWQGGNATVAFFVAIIDGTRNIVAKEVFQSEIEFRDGRRRAGVREDMEQIIFLKQGESGTNYEVVVGLQVTEQQLQQNRGRRP